MHWMLITFAGFAGSFHCVGMCGGFACGLGASTKKQTRIQNFLTHLYYNIGRVVTYIFIGALAGAIGEKIIGVSVDSKSHVGHSIASFSLGGDLGVFQKFLTIIAGSLMLLMAMQLFGLWRHKQTSWMAIGGEKLVSPIRSLMRSSYPGAPVALGVVNGFLPCPLVYAFAVMAAITGSALDGMLTMAAFGIGTFPAMFLVGLVGRLSNINGRTLGVRLAGVFVAIFGLITILRGLTPSILHAG